MLIYWTVKPESVASPSADTEVLRDPEQCYNSMCIGMFQYVASRKLDTDMQGNS
jgi:hypothetical protein